MSRTAKAYLSTEHLIHNVQVIRHQAPSSSIIAMVKANAYGHGIRSVSKRIEHLVEMFGVASIDEAISLRKVGITKPIILMEGIFEREELELACQNNCHVVFHSHYQVAWLESQRLSQNIHAWIKLDSGMGRLGFDSSMMKSIYDRLMRHVNVNPKVRILSHLACSSDKDHSMNQEQLSVFDQTMSLFSTEYSLCNTSAIFHFPEYQLDFVRPGIALLGIGPDQNLKPVMTLKAQLIAVKHLKKGQSVGYNAKYRCPKDMRVGVVSLGYGDGYPQQAPCSTPTWLQGTICPLVGQVSMDMLTIDLSSYPAAGVGQWVTLWGDKLPISIVAKHCQSTAYELMTRVQHRVKFEWTDTVNV